MNDLVARLAALAGACALVAACAGPILVANGQQCAATSQLRGQFCSAPQGGFANKANCVAAYNACLNAMPSLMHRWCVQIDQANCNRNDDCPDGSCCFVHAANKQQWINLQCYQDGQNQWRFEIFDVADCKCDCSKTEFPTPPEGPEGITLACELGAVDCSRCETPAAGAAEDGSGACAVKTTPWEL